ncbi:MAG: histidinol dehydrogenase [Phycisphaeraceae bacterium]|nr:histidinol dehydrogenase [Phycisphaeraceae bacterium]
MLIPSIDILGGRAVQLVGGDPSSIKIDAGDPLAVAERFAILGEIAVIDLDAALARGTNAPVIREIARRFPVRVGGGIRSVDAARQWLDAGAHRVILGTAATPEILSQLPRDRVIAALDARHDEVVVEGWQRATGARILDRIAALRAHAGGFLVTFVEREGRMQGTDLDRAAAIVHAAGDARVTIAGGVTTADEIAALDRLGADAQVGMAIYTGALDPADAFAAVLKPPEERGVHRDRTQRSQSGAAAKETGSPPRSPRSSSAPSAFCLWPTIVCDEAGHALGLVYSSPESLRAAVAERRGVYFSRSRNALWRKGESSGDTQELLRIDVDCDRDALRFTVRQRGRGFCHTGTHTCFGDARGLHALARRLAAPPESRDPASYTSRLLRDPALLASKLREEAAELAEAQAPSDVAHEAADVLYFTLARLAAAGVPLDAVERELDRRALKLSRRPGDAKPETHHRDTESTERGNEQVNQNQTTPGSTASSPSRLSPLCASVVKSDRLLRVIDASAVPALRRSAIDPATLAAASEIVSDVRARGEQAVRAHAERLGDLRPGEPLLIEPAAMRRALDALDRDDRAALERAAERIRAFAEAQRASLHELALAVPGGQAGHWIAPVERAGCYAPGGRFPLPSSVLMTAVTARAAGVREVIVASPRPAPATLAAAAIAGADAVLAVGGAQAIAALAFGCPPLALCDAVVGPGNRWVTAAKQLVAGQVAIDTLAGPSELLIIADDTADPRTVAADLLAQAEHDTDACAVLVTTHPPPPRRRRSRTRRATRLAPHRRHRPRRPRQRLRRRRARPRRRRRPLRPFRPRAPRSHDPRRRRHRPPMHALRRGLHRPRRRRSPRRLRRRPQPHPPHRRRSPLRRGPERPALPPHAHLAPHRRPRRRTPPHPRHRPPRPPRRPRSPRPRRRSPTSPRRGAGM